MLLASPLGELRAGYDLTLPPILSQEDLQHQLDSWSELPLLMPLQRKFLIYFSGKYGVFIQSAIVTLLILGSYEGSAPPSLLQLLQQLSSNLKTSVSIQLSCLSPLSNSQLNNSWSLCGDKQTRLNTNRESIFSIIPAHRDRDPASLVRLVEALSAGAVPVLCGDQLSLPYGEVLDWDRAVLQVPSSRLHELHYLIRCDVI